jgi:hypothetical protein
MERTLRLVGMGIDGQFRGFEVMAISRPDGVGDVANLGLTLAESKLLLAQVQRQHVAEQANTHATFRPDCGACGGACQVKDRQPHRITTLFGEVRLKLPRFLCDAGATLATAHPSPAPSRFRPVMAMTAAVPGSPAR